MSVVPTKEHANRILQMCEVRLLGYKHLQPWACSLIESLGEAPAWLCELASLRYHGDVEKCLREYIFSPPFEQFDRNALCDYAVAGLMVRFDLRQISWGTLLDEAGSFVDCADAGAEECEWYYEMLNELEDSEYDHDVAVRQVERVRELHADAVEKVYADYEPFLQAFRKDRDRRRGR